MVENHRFFHFSLNGRESPLFTYIICKNHRLRKSFSKIIVKKWILNIRQRQVHLLRPEQPAVHSFQPGGDCGSEFHFPQNIPIQICAGGDFDKGESLVGQAENRAFCNVKDILKSFFAGVVTGKGDMFDIVFEFDVWAVLNDFQLSISDFYIAFSSGEGSEETNRLCALRDIDKTAGSGDFAGEFRDIDISVPVDFRSA